MEDDATNRVTFDYCKIVYKNDSSSNGVKKDNTGQVSCLKLKRVGGGGVLVNDISQVAPLKPRMMQHYPPPPYSFTVFLTRTVEETLL